MYICLCKGITEQKIREEVARNQNATVKEITRRLGLASDCGVCVQDSIRTIKECLKHQTHSDHNSKK